MEKSFNNENVKENVKKILTVNMSDFFAENYISLHWAVVMCGTLKEVYDNKSINLIDNMDFQRCFSKYYSLRFVSEDFKKKYFEKMNEVRVKPENDLKKLAEELTDGEKYQFSFVTKLLNIMDDVKYPIYDSNVINALGISSAYGSQCRLLKL